jgi:hypothetical protein
VATAARDAQSLKAELAMESQTDVVRMSRT